MTTPVITETYHTETALLMARLCGLVYRVHDESEWQWEERFRRCLPELLGEVEGVEIVADSHNLAGVIDLPDKRLIVVRGTDQLDDWLRTNFLRGLDYDSFRGGRHRGFGIAAFKISGWLLTKHLEAKPVYLAGHSLGGAVVTLLADHLQNVRGIYTYGSPRCMDGEAADHWQDVYGARNHRHYCYGDLVPHTPCLWRGYRHTGRPIYLDRAGQMHAEPSLWYRAEQTVGAWWRDVAWLFAAADDGLPTSVIGRLIHIFGSKYHQMSHYESLLERNVKRLNGEIK